MKLADKSIKQVRYLLIPIFILLSIFLYFYMDYFFETGVDYYGHYLSEMEKPTGEKEQIFEGKVENENMTLKLILLSGDDTFIEITGEDFTSEYLLEGAHIDESFRLFDGSNHLLLSGILENDGIITEKGETINAFTYMPLAVEPYGIEKPDPVLMVLIASGLRERSRGTVPVLFLGGLILVSLFIDIAFPDFFFRLKNLKWRGAIEVPPLYRTMQKLSWILGPFLLMAFLYFSI